MATAEVNYVKEDTKLRFIVKYTKTTAKKYNVRYKYYGMKGFVEVFAIRDTISYIVKQKWFENVR